MIIPKLVPVTERLPDYRAGNSLQIESTVISPDSVVPVLSIQGEEIMDYQMATAKLKDMLYRGIRSNSQNLPLFLPMHDVIIDLSPDEQIDQEEQIKEQIEGIKEEGQLVYVPINNFLPVALPFN